MSDPRPVLDLIEAFRHSKAMFAAVTLGIFDRLYDRPSTAEHLADELHLHKGALTRLLDACAALELLHKESGLYRNSRVADQYLYSGSPDTLSGYIRYSDEALFPMWGNLADAVREGTPRWEQTKGVGGAIFSGFYRNDETMREFLRGMHGFGMITSPKVVDSFDLAKYRRMVDLGGGTGHLAIAACRRYAELNAVIFDLPRVAAVAREYIALAEFEGRVDVKAGDFFRDPLPAADIYAAGRILHDWDDGKAGELLRAIIQRLPSGGALLLAEKLLNDDGVGPVAANMQSLNMLVVAEGRERTLGEFTRLLEAAGFSQVQGKITGVALDAILAVKP